MAKVFISMPMRNLFEDEIRDRQAKYLKMAGEHLKQPVELVESYQTKGSALEMLGESIKRMAGAEYVIFADGWENARGCKIEMSCALSYNKKILIEHGDVIQEVF